MMFKKIFVVINPVSGKPEPVLSTLHETFKEEKIQWDVCILQQSDIAQILDRAEKWGADLIAVYGGDGSVSSVADVLVGRDMPLAILPGGTANVMSMQLGIPQKLADACGVLVDERSRFRTIDMGRVNGRSFLCQVGIGFHSRVLEETDDQSKSRFGVMAYVGKGIKNLFAGENVQLDITVDGKQVRTEAFSCIVCNVGMTGMKVALSPVDICDGLLDVFVVRNLKLKSLEAEVSDPQDNPDASLVHWRGEKIVLRSEPPESVEYDGEVFRDEAYNIEIVKKAIRVLVPGY